MCPKDVLWRFQSDVRWVKFLGRPQDLNISTKRISVIRGEFLSFLKICTKVLEKYVPHKKDICEKITNLSLSLKSWTESWEKHRLEIQEKQEVSITAMKSEKKDYFASFKCNVLKTNVLRKLLRKQWKFPFTNVKRCFRLQFE